MDSNLYDGPGNEATYARTTAQWQKILSDAKSSTRIPGSALDLTSCLDRIPQLPHKIPAKLRSLDGFSIWKDGAHSCSIKEKKQQKEKLFLTKRHPTTCSISPSPNFRIWNGKRNNGLALLILGWAYVLSANLAERQTLSIQYAPLPKAPSSCSARLDLKYASPRELRWWKAITSPGTGWSVGGVVTPWAIAVRDLEIAIRGKTGRNQQPPSSREAATYLSRLCKAYDLSSQCSAALAAAMTIPLHANISPLKAAAIELPKVSLATCNAVLDEPNLPAEFDLLGYYMTLSLCPWALGPSLWSVFWNPDVPCNHVGAWILPIASVLEPIIQNNELELLARMFSFSPISPLWLGLLLCGNTAIMRCLMPSLVDLRDYPFFCPSVNAAAWTGVSQSFMDCCQTDLSPDGTVSRADIWRLRYYFSFLYPGEGFQYTPRYGWAPFGRMKNKDIELEIREHLLCLHQWEYSHWAWSLSGETDAGFWTDGMRARCRTGNYSAPIHTNQEVEIDNRQAMLEISERATATIFWWCCNQVERGFGRIVPWRSGPEIPVEATKKETPKDPAFIREWLDTIET